MITSGTDTLASIESLSAAILQHGYSYTVSWRPVACEWEVDLALDAKKHASFRAQTLQLALAKAAAVTMSLNEPFDVSVSWNSDLEVFTAYAVVGRGELVSVSRQNRMAAVAEVEKAAYDWLIAHPSERGWTDINTTKGRP